jgi:uncharacterized Zn-finger protein
MRKVFLFSLLLCLQHNASNAMKRPRNDDINSWLLSEDLFPKKQSTEQKNIPMAQKCPRPEHLQRTNKLEPSTKKQKKQFDSNTPQPHAIKAIKSPRAEFAQLATFQKIVKKPIIEQDLKTKKKNICDECTAGFVHKSDLNRHKKTAHSDEKGYSCDQCNKNFTQKYTLTVHKNTVHSDERPYKCDQCSSDFKIKSNLTIHKNTVHSAMRPYSCNHCDKKYKSQGVLDVHLAACHSHIEYICSLCDATFKSEKNLTRHEDSVHATTRPYKCNHTKCHKNFKTKAELNLHKKRHTSPKSYICECGKSFITLFELNQHKISHSSEKPHLCKQCNKYFAYKRSLKVHQKETCKGKQKNS